MSMSQLVSAVKAAQAAKIDKFLPLPDTLGRTGVGKSTWYALIAAGKAPKPYSLSPRRVGWSELEISDWIEARKSSPDQGLNQGGTK